MPDNLPLPVVIAALSALVCVIGILWRKIQQLEDRIKNLEAARLADEKRHSTEIRELMVQVLNTAKESAEASKESAASVRELAKQVMTTSDMYRRHHIALDSKSGHAGQ